MISNRHTTLITRLIRVPDDSGWKFAIQQAKKEEAVMQDCKWPKLNSSKSKRNTGNRSPYQRPQSYSSEDSDGSQDQSSYQVRKSRSSEINHSRKSHRQSTDKKRQSYQQSFEMEEHQSDLLWLVRKHPLLWDHKNLQFKNRNKRRAIWMFISDVLGIDEDRCKEHWKKLRARYTREINKLPECIALDFKGLMETDLNFLKTLFQDVSIAEDSEAADIERCNSIFDKTPVPMEFRSWVRSISAPIRSNAQPSTSRQSRDRSPVRPAARTSNAVSNVRQPTPSTSQSLPGTTSSPAPSSQTGPLNTCTRSTANETGNISSDVELSGDGRDGSASETPTEQVADQRGENPSPLFNTRPVSKRSKSKQDKWLAAMVAAHIHKFSPEAKEYLLCELKRVEPKSFQQIFLL